MTDPVFLNKPVHNSNKEVIMEIPCENCGLAFDFCGMFGLRLKKTGQMLRVETVSNDEEDDDYDAYCVPVIHRLSPEGNGVWLNDAVTAEYVRHNPTAYYNADYKKPYHEFAPEELEVVKVTKAEISLTFERADVKIPDKYMVMDKNGEDREFGLSELYSLMLRGDCELDIQSLGGDYKINV